MARGGKRVGTAGRSYSNRSDLQTGVRKPSTPKVAPAATNPAYGDQAGQLRSLQALPLATSQPQVQPSTGGGGTEAAPPLVPPNLPPFNRPTERPNEPLTTGIATGPGAGPEVLPRPMTGPDQSVADFVNTLVTANPSPELRQLADFLASGRG